MFLSESNYNYKVDIALPFPVNSEHGDAKFVKVKHMLEVVLPVIMPQEEVEKYQYDGPSGFENDHEQKTVIEVVEDLRKQRLPSYDDDDDDDYHDGNDNSEHSVGVCESGKKEQETGDQGTTDSNSNNLVHFSGENVVHEFDVESQNNALASQTAPSLVESSSNAETLHETQVQPKINIEIKNTLMYELD